MPAPRTASVGCTSSGEDSVIFAAGRTGLGLEQHIEDELVLSRIVVWIGSLDGAEGRVAKLLVRAVVVRDVEVRRVGDVEALDTELNCRAVRDREVLEER